MEHNKEPTKEAWIGFCNRVDESLLKVLDNVNTFNCFNPSREGSIVKTKLEEARMWNRSLKELHDR